MRIAKYCAAIFGIWGFTFSLSADNSLQKTLDLIESEKSITNIYKTKIPSEDLARKATISFGNQLEEINFKDGYMIFELTEKEKADLEVFGFKFEVANDFIKKRNMRLESIQESMKSSQSRLPYPSNQATGIPNYPCYETVEETFVEAEAMVKRAPKLAEFIDIGDSWAKTTGQGGYDIKVLKLTNQDINEEKPILFVNTAIHAREYTTAPLNVAFAKWLVDGYGTNADATWILDFHEVHLLLQGNPDGRKRAEAGLSWRKNANENFCALISRSRGGSI
ncbi:MAG: hypothetical protein HRU19_14255 [Pseudobacteriovorax sp.]|nr:hypothetical protein [Pseudobacteriovorax sp.]